MVAASVAALTVYDMVKGLERGVTIEQVMLLEKTGGRHDWRRDPQRPDARRRSSRSARRGRRSGAPTRAATSSRGSPARWASRSSAREIVSDERDAIEERLRHWSDVERCELILTTGGTGVAPRDVTPEATLAVIEREVPGIAEAMRDASREHTRHWMLSRAVAGIRGATLIVNFPGSPRSIEQAGEALAGALPHALALLAGEPDRPSLGGRHMCRPRGRHMRRPPGGRMRPPV